MLAVLLNAILQLRSRDARDVIDAENWIRGGDATGDTTDWPFSFNNICEALDIESGYLARGVLTWRDRPTDGVRRAPVRHVRAARTHVRLRERRRPAITTPLQR